MGNEATEQNKPPQSAQKQQPSSWVLIVVAIIGAAGVIIAALITAKAFRAQEVNVKLIDMDTKQGIPGKVFSDTDREGISGTPDSPAHILVKRGNRYIRAESEGYKPKIVPSENVAGILTIEMEKLVAVTSTATPLSLIGWSAWPRNALTIRGGANNNECIINSVGRLRDAAGFNNTTLNTGMLRGKTLVLYFSNTGASRFSQNRMVKVEYNRANYTENYLLTPTNASLLSGEYLPAGNTPPDQGIEFKIPADFDGKLEFTFYQAELNDLRITAFYR
jgi:hypothetical protein